MVANSYRKLYSIQQWTTAISGCVRCGPLRAQDMDLEGLVLSNPISVFIFYGEVTTSTQFSLLVLQNEKVSGGLGTTDSGEPEQHAQLARCC